MPRTMIHQLQAMAERREDQPALWTLRQNTWFPTSWRQYARHVKHLALGFISLGLQPKQPVAILSFNREEWVVGALAAMAAGGVPVGLYTTLSPEQMQYVLGHSEAAVVLVENEAALAKVTALQPQLPKLKHLVVMEPHGPLAPGVLTYEEVMQRGSALDDTVYFDRLNAAKPDDIAALIYTSGTTGNPKGVMLTHHNLTWTARALTTTLQLREREVLLSYLPLSHIAEQACSIYGPVWHGIEVYFAQSFEKLGDHLRDVRPTVFFGVPRVWEKFKARADASLSQQTGTKKKLLDWARQVATRYHQADLEGRQMSLTLLGQYRLAQRLVFAPLKKRIGLDRAHLLATSAAPISRDVLDFFASVDLVIREVYGQSEVTGPTTVSTLGATRLGTLGRPMPGVEVRINEGDGEILVRGGNVCAGYFKEPAATADLIDGQGWLHSGDVGQLDPDGYLVITGRKKEIIVTSGGKKTAPAGIEGLLKGIDPVGNAMVIGDRRNYLVALLAVDPEKLPAFAKAQGLPEDPRHLVEAPAFRAYLTERIERDVNAKIARFETIKRFAVLPHDFTIEGGELTASLKVRRSVVEKKYEALIASLYATSEPA